MYKLDYKDKKIIEVLKNNADYTTRQIAKKTLLPITTIHNRIKKLKKENVITKFTIDLDPMSVGKSFSVYILISANLMFLKQNKRTQYDIAKDLKKFEFTELVDIVSGGTDLIVKVNVKDVQEFDNILLNKIQKIEGIEKTQSLVVIHKTKS